MRPITFSILALFTLSSGALAQLPIAYDTSLGDSDPAGQGWTGNETVLGDLTIPTGNAGSVDASPETGDAWRLDDRLTGTNENLPNYSRTLSTDTARCLIHDTGFRMTFVVRAVANHNSTFGNQNWSGFLELGLPSSVLPGSSARRTAIYRG